MRIESSVTSISWIPSEAIEGMPKLPFEIGIGKYDEPPPDRVAEEDIAELRDADRFREANHLKAWIEVEDGKIVGHGQEGEGYVGSTTFRFGVGKMTVPGVGFEVLRPEPEVSDDGRAVRPDRRRARRVPGSAPSRREAVLPRPLRVGVDDARADDPRGRLVRVRARGREPVPAALDLRRGRQPRARSQGRSTSRTGTGRRTARTRRGATRSRMHSRPSRRARSSGRSRASS